MSKLKKQQFIVVFILALLSALEPFSIDLYLPGFLKISQYYQTDLKAVQFSISTFLAGFAVGQLFWGIISDKYGRKWPTIASLLLFIAATIACIYSVNIEQFWIARFFQAFAGCAGVVIARAIVNEYFEQDDTMRVFSLLAIIAGVAPIIGPVAGNFLVSHFTWQSTFITLLALGIISLLLVVFFLPETKVKTIAPVQKRNLIQDFRAVLRVKIFLKYTLIGSVTYSILMIYLANAPYLIMEYGQLSSAIFSYIFAFNAVGLMVGAWVSSAFTRWWSIRQIILYTTILGLFCSIIFLGLCMMQQPIEWLLVPLFFIIFTLGVLFPATTKLALEPFHENSGSASALLGSLQLMLTFIISAATNLIPVDLLLLTGLALLVCHGLYLACYAIKEE
ncbi:multidrug effflux MFS transporter [Myroides odoratus]|uniref:Multidrug effflux MFS transporter n=1 Tax=Myroides odoratus TaxID=256 RepID=A0A9Q7E7V8_MYROD|nr:multidrug effflux MFS transporter [Myroides odoratus]EHQ41581.1 drug resistance transporter, Bcr/CflA subfamily [Myroides odoratus DSM 2801]EKB08800.1 drug resistance transporter, Bcr/CflA subfamily [Myroides odoratus CIP 103059]QQT98997.1 multidrug effflux MFS transporter [Myroides odoratus]WQD58813.1 multidrug effflux MFS transporter [Myroides odoratus]STZ28845.1 Inner membrane transport protein ydhC [Myroides odoratus]